MSAVYENVMRPTPASFKVAGGLASIWQQLV